jgi:hypothetical protein
MKTKLISLLAFALIACTDAFAQGLVLPAPSPTSTVTQQVGVTNFTLIYSRPSARKRTIFGKLVPYGELWRTGANRATTLAFDTEVMMGGQKIAPGKYSLFTIPTENEWTIILNKVWDLGGTDGYNKDQDAVRFTVKPQQVSDYVETFTIGFNDFTNNSCSLVLEWDLMMVKVPISMDIAPQVKKNIDAALGGTWRPYASAASYYVDNNMELDAAVDYCTKALGLQEHFWTLNIRSKAYAKQGKFAEAVADAEKSLKLSQDAKNDFYTKQNQDNLAEWKPKVPTAPVKKK